MASNNNNGKNSSDEGFFMGLARSAGQAFREGMSNKTADADTVADLAPVEPLRPAYANVKLRRTMSSLIGVYGTPGITIVGSSMIDPYNVQNGGAYKNVVADFITAGATPLMLSPTVVGNGATNLPFPVLFGGGGIVYIPGMVITFSDSDLNFVKERILDLTPVYTPRGKNGPIPPFTLSVKVSRPGSLLILPMDVPLTGSSVITEAEFSQNYRGIAAYSTAVGFSIAGAWATLGTQMFVPPSTHPIWTSLLGDEDHIVATLDSGLGATRQVTSSGMPIRQ